MTAKFVRLRLLDLSMFFGLLGLGSLIGMPYLAAAWSLGMLWRELVPYHPIPARSAVGSAVPDGPDQPA